METLLSAEPVVVHAADASHAAAARHGVQRIARALEFDATREGRAAIVATEAVSNMLKHAGGGTFLARALQSGAATGIEMLAIDAGPGMEDLAESSRDGVSTAGTSGTGLGAMGRQADHIDVFTEPGAGTIVRMLVWDREAPGEAEGYDIGVVCVPKVGETICGDAWSVRTHDAGATFLVADGLGHGPDASRAAASAVDAFERHPDYGAARLLETAHARLRSTRGAALAVMRHEVAANEIAFAGVGNISATILAGAARRAMVSHNGIVGLNVQRAQEYRYPWSRGELMVVHSDGLESQWSLAGLPGIGARHPSLIAAALYRRHWRRRDDVTVLVARPR
jgi:anti-sigma regulatory factor (Ser/Thr protein kinase)